MTNKSRLKKRLGRAYMLRGSFVLSEPPHDKMNLHRCAPSDDSYRPTLLSSLIRAFVLAICHLIRLSRCACWSEISLAAHALVNIFAWRDLLISFLLVDGGWSDWSNWTECTVTCSGGVRSRTRECNKPSPQYGGQYCMGNSSDTEACNTEVCPPGQSFCSALR